jgi:hypothetical protein
MNTHKLLEIFSFLSFVLYIYTVDRYIPARTVGRSSNNRNCLEDTVYFLALAYASPCVVAEAEHAVMAAASDSTGAAVVPVGEKLTLWPAQQVSPYLHVLLPLPQCWLLYSVSTHMPLEHVLPGAPGLQAHDAQR